MNKQNAFEIAIKGGIVMPLGAVEYYWDRNVLSTWEELEKYLPQIFDKFWREIDSLRNQDQVLSSVLTAEAEKRYHILFETLLEQIIHVKNCNTTPIVQWILLGSLLEATMQIFLQVYLCDYNKSTWQQWKILTVKLLKKHFVTC